VTGSKYLAVMKTSNLSSPMHRLAIVAITALLFGAAYAQPTTFYSNDGEATAYIDWHDDLTIYLWNGSPVAYLHEGRSPNHWHVYAFPGTFLGWYEAGVIWDQRGDGILARADVLTSPPQREPVRGIKGLKPIKGLRELAPLKPTYSYHFSSTSPGAFFLGSRTTSTVAPQASSAGRYAGAGRDQTINTVSRNGDTVALLDGSQWEIYFVDQVFTSTWIPMTRVTVTRAERPLLGHDYILTPQRGREARAKFLGF
jgi:hypothetical protein